MDNLCMQRTSLLTKLFLYTYTDAYFAGCRYLHVYEYTTHYKIVKLTVHVRHPLPMAVHLCCIAARARSLFIMTSGYWEMSSEILLPNIYL